MKTLYLMRGLPGSGKSTLAKELGGVICSTDDFFMKNGEYVFQREKLKENHQKNKEKTEQLLKEDEPVVIVDNTNISILEILPYWEMGRKYGYEVRFKIPKYGFNVNWCLEHNTHNVPEETIRSMRDRWDTLIGFDLINNSMSYSEKQLWKFFHFFDTRPFLNEMKNSNFLFKTLELIEQGPHHPEGNAWEHTIQVCESLSTTSQVLMLAALLHDIGKVFTFKLREKNGELKHTFYGHDEVGQYLARDFLRQAEFPEEIVEEVGELVLLHMRRMDFKKDYSINTFKKLKSRMKFTTPEKLYYLFLADVNGRTPPGEEKKVIETEEIINYRKLMEERY